MLHVIMENSGLGSELVLLMQRSNHFFVPLCKHCVCVCVCVLGSPGTVSCPYNIDPFKCSLDSAGDGDLLIKQTSGLVIIEDAG